MMNVLLPLGCLHGIEIYVEVQEFCKMLTAMKVILTNVY